MYDVTNRKSFQEVTTWLQEVEKFSSADVVKMIVGNKCDDTSNRKVSYEEGLEFAETYKLRFIETSAKNGTNIEEAFRDLGRDMKETLNHIDRTKKNITLGGKGPGRAIKSKK